MTNYIRRFSAGDLLRSSLQIYGSNLITFVAIFVVAMLPAVIVNAIAHVERNTWLELSSATLNFLLGLLASASGTVAVSDICLGHEPRVQRSYRRAFAEMSGKVIGTGMLVWIVLMVGFILLIVPGLLFTLWYLLAIPVVVLERVGGIAALRRSRELGKGCYLRNAGVFFLLFISVFLPLLLGGFLLGALIGFSSHMLGLWTGNEYLISGLGHGLGGVMGTLVAPIGTIGTVLLYYDMRVRKEAYDIQMLAEELRR